MTRQRKRFSDQIKADKTKTSQAAKTKKDRTTEWVLKQSGYHPHRRISPRTLNKDRSDKIYSLFSQTTMSQSSQPESCATTVKQTSEPT
jgi:hypothetical protein